VAGDTPAPWVITWSMEGGRMGGRSDASEGTDGSREAASADVFVAVGGRTEMGDPSAGLLSTVSTSCVPTGLGISAPVKEHAHPSSAHLLQRDKPSITVHRFYSTVLLGLNHACLHSQRTLDSLHLWHARNAFRLLLEFPSLENDRIPCMTCEGLVCRLFLSGGFPLLLSTDACKSGAGLRDREQERGRSQELLH